MPASTLARITEVGTLENVYRLQIMNAKEEAQNYRLRVRGLDGIEIKTETVVPVEAAQSRWVVVRVDIPYGSATSGSHPIWFEISSEGGDSRVTEKSVFLVPR